MRRLRIAVTAFFGLHGFIFAGWVVRIPAIKQQTDASADALGLALLGLSVGAVAAMMLTGRLCHRFGNHPMTVAGGTVLALGVALPPLTHSALALGCVLLVSGVGFGWLNVAVNSAAVDLGAALRRPLMPSFHAAFSLGGMLGAGLGGLVAGQLSVTWHLLLLTAIGLTITAVAGRTLLAHPVPSSGQRESTAKEAESAERTSPASGHGAAREPGQDECSGGPSAIRAVPTGQVVQTGRATQTGQTGWAGQIQQAGAVAGQAGRTEAVARSRRARQPAAPQAGGSRPGGSRRLVVVLGLICLCTSYGEGALADWSALHLAESLDASAGTAAAGYSVFALAMAVGRLTGSAQLRRLKQTHALVVGCTTATFGMLLGALAPTVWLALTGFVITGLGLANVVPIVLGQAGALAGPRGVGTACSVGFTGMLVGPVAIGFLTESFSLPAALTSVAALAGVAALIAFGTRHSLPGRAA